MRINGPYVHTSGRLKGRRYINIIHDDGRRTSMLYSRWLMQEKLGRPLLRSEHVDHIDEDPTNDDESNLQLLSPTDNAKKTARLRRSISWYEFECPICGKASKKQLRHVKHNWNLGKAGPFCGRSCAAKNATR